MLRDAQISPDTLSSIIFQLTSNAGASKVIEYRIKLNEAELSLLREPVQKDEESCNITRKGLMERQGQ